MSKLFNDEFDEVASTLMDARAKNATTPELCRRIDNALSLLADISRRTDALADGGKSVISLFPAPEPDDRKEMLGLFKASSEIAVEAMRRARFLESALTLRLEGWEVQAEFAPDSAARGMLRAKIEEVKRILANARA